MPRSIGRVVSSGRATLMELQTFYGIMDVYDILEVMMVDAHNTRILAKPR